MTNSRLIAYLKTMSKAEMKDFGRFISAAKGIKDVIVLFNYLQPYHPEYPEKNLVKSKIATKLFPNERNIAKKFTNIMYRFGQLLDDFLVQEELKVKEAEKDLLLLHALKRRQLDHFFFKKAEQIEEDWTKNPPPGLEHLHNIYRLKEMYHHTNHNYPLLKKTPVSPKNFIHHIDTYYFATKLYWALCIRHNENFLTDLDNAENPEYLLNEILSLSRTNSFEKVPQIKLISNLLTAYINSDFEDYLSLKEHFINFINLYNEREKNDIAIFLHSACYENYKIGKSASLEQLFDLNCLMIDNQFLLRNGRIETDQFWNIVNIGFELNKFSWTENFIDEYRDYLEKSEKQDVLTICDAMISYHNKDYEEAIRKLATVKFQNVLYGLHARSIQLKSYYELGDEYYQMFLSLTKSFYLFLNRNALSKETKLRVKNFIAFSKKLIIVKNKPHLLDIEGFNAKLNRENIGYKSWLSSKLEELRSSKKEKITLLK